MKTRHLHLHPFLFFGIVSCIVFCSLALASPSVAAQEASNEASSTSSPVADLAFKKRPKRRAARRVAVHDFKVVDVSDRVMRVVTNALVDELRKLRGLGVVSLDEVRSMLDYEDTKFSVGCSVESSCLAEIAGALGVDDIVTGSLVRIDDVHIFTLRRIMQTDARVYGSLTHRLTVGTGEEFLAVIGESVAELFDGFALKPGAERGVSAETALFLNPPPLQPWVFWSEAVAVGGIAALASVATLGAAWTFVDFENYKSSIQATGRADGKILQDKQTTNRIFLGASVAFSALAAGAGIATGVSAAFVDWDNHGRALGGE